MLPFHVFITGVADNVILRTAGLGGKMTAYKPLLSTFLILESTIKVAQAQPATSKTIKNK